MTDKEKADLQAEIESFVLSNQHQEELPPAWMVHGIVASHEEGILGPDRDWALRMSAIAVRAGVGEYFRKTKQAEEEGEDPQLMLPGYSRLQIRYIIDRHGERVAVRIDACTNGELLKKADEQEKHADGCREHARELRRYVQERQRLSKQA